MKILFQGDSITDADWNRTYGTLGSGYPTIVAGELGTREPGRHTFLNRGVSGDRVVDVYARIKTDVWNLNPDLMSLLIGVNDVWHEVECGNGVAADRFERIYRMLIEDTQKACPNLRLMLMEPFVLRGPATQQAWDFFHTEVAKRARITEHLAQEYHLPFVPLQDMLEQACQQADVVYWLMDGVHPTAPGHRLIADAWLEVYHRDVCLSAAH